MKNKSKRKSLKKVIQTIGFMVFISIVFLSIGILLFVNPSNQNSLFGYRFYVVLSDSMKPEFSAGDLIITKEVDTTSLGVGDIITFRSIDPRTYNEIITHEIVGETYYQDNFAFITKGINTDDNDLYPAMNYLILGKQVGHIPNAGYVIDYFDTTQGYILLVLIPFLVLAGLEVKGFVKVYKQKKQSELNALEKEKEALKQELEALKQKHQIEDEDITFKEAPSN